LQRGTFLRNKENAVSNISLINDHPTTPSTIRAGVRNLVLRLRCALFPSHEDKMARRAFLNTFRLDDRMLDDIGVTREEVEWAAGLPLQVDAAQALHARASTRRAREDT
jgi:uncharacterized protein YjiS (DUF1127 family)